MSEEWINAVEHGGVVLDLDNEHLRYILYLYALDVWM